MMPNTSSLLATRMDAMMLVLRGVAIAQPGAPFEDLPGKSGDEVFAELGGRFLLRYLTEEQVGSFRNGSTSLQYATPTAYSPTEAIVQLALPSVRRLRRYVLVLDPRRIPLIAGPQWAVSPGGIQYLLIAGFPASAIVVPGAPTGAWELVVQ